MSTHMKLIIPLLDSNITKDDLTEECGFFNAYPTNKNEPYLDNHIFLLYDAFKHNERTINKEIRLTTSKSFYGKKPIRIKGKYYNVYIFTITNTDIKRLLRGFRHENMESFTKICNFWNGSDEMVNKYLSDLLPSTECAWEEVPEEDYIMSHAESINRRKNPGSLVINSQGLIVC